VTCQPLIVRLGRGRCRDRQPTPIGLVAPALMHPRFSGASFEQPDPWQSQPTHHRSQPRICNSLFSVNTTSNYAYNPLHHHLTAPVHLVETIRHPCGLRQQSPSSGPHCCKHTHLTFFHVYTFVRPLAAVRSDRLCGHLTPLHVTAEWRPTSCGFS